MTRIDIDNDNDIQRTPSKRFVAFETLVTFLTIMNNNFNIQRYPWIKSDGDIIFNSCSLLLLHNHFKINTIWHQVMLAFSWVWYHHHWWWQFNLIGALQDVNKMSAVEISSRPYEGRIHILACNDVQKKVIIIQIVKESLSWRISCNKKSHDQNVF